MFYIQTHRICRYYFDLFVIICSDSLLFWALVNMRASLAVCKRQTQKLRGLRLRDNRQGRTELKKFVTIEWNVELQRSYSLSYHTQPHTNQRIWVCMYVSTWICVRVSTASFSLLAACCFRARYEFLPTTFEMICCIWAQHPNQCCVMNERREKKQNTPTLIYCANVHSATAQQTHTITCCSHISQWMKRQWNTNTQ